MSHAVLAPYLEYLVRDDTNSSTTNPKYQTIARRARANTAAISLENLGKSEGGIYVANPPKLSEEEIVEFWRPKCINRTDFDRGGGRGREPLRQMPDVPPTR